MAEPTDYYTSRYSGEEIDTLLDIVKNGGGGGGDFADRKLSNLDTPQEALANLGAGVRPNLHDNWFFPNVGGFPIAQKGGTSLDRWGEVGTSVSLLNKGVKLTSTGLDSYLAQYTENPQLYAGETLTLSAIVRDISGEAYAQLYAYNGSTYTTISSSKATSDDIVSTEVTIPTDTVAIFSRLYVSEGGSATFVASKLEEGNGQTLGYKKSDGSVVMLPQSGKKLEQMLAECQRYYRRIFLTYVKFSHFDGSTARVGIPVSGMRIAPVCKIIGTPTVYNSNNWSPVSAELSVSAQGRPGDAEKSDSDVIVLEAKNVSSADIVCNDLVIELSAEL